MSNLNETHDPKLRSWVESANQPGCEFPIQNLPFGIFRRRGAAESFRPGVAIGDQILDLRRLNELDLFDGAAKRALGACTGTTLNDLMATGSETWSALRLALSRALRAGSPLEEKLRPLLVPQAQAEYSLPARIGDYTDFYASVYHATSVGRLFRPDNPLMPNYKWVPIGYHGRASSIAISGQKFHRPVGQLMPKGATAPIVAPCQRLDYELEVGIFMGPGNALGTRIPIDLAEERVFGLCILNDWSARDIQAWEYQPLGPFLAKNFASTISPWIVTLEALEPFRVRWERSAEDPQPLPYLESEKNRAQGAFDIQLQVELTTEKSRAQGAEPAVISKTSFRHSYWSIAQMVAHHTINGCNLEPGDLLGTGTQSGPTEAEAGSLLELTQGGQKPLQLPWGEERTFLQDGDEVIMRAWAEKEGYPRIGFGVSAGTVLPAMPL